MSHPAAGCTSRRSPLPLKSFDLLIRIPEKKKKKLRQKNGLEPRHPCLSSHRAHCMDFSGNFYRLTQFFFPLNTRPFALPIPYSPSLFLNQLPPSIFHHDTRPFSINASSLVYPAWSSIQDPPCLTRLYFVRSKSIIEGIKVEFNKMFQLSILMPHIAFILQPARSPWKAIEPLLVASTFVIRPFPTTLSGTLKVCMHSREITILPFNYAHRQLFHHPVM